MALSRRAQDTVVALIEGMESKAIPYSIARNYENYPDFGHDLDLYFPESAERFEVIAKNAAANYGWDLVTRCDHWAQSRVRAHNIDVFHFYKIATGETLRVDLFQSFLVWGLPLLGARDIVRMRERHESGLFYRPNLAYENMFRVLQIAKLSKHPNQEKKVIRYKTKILSFLSENRASLIKAQAGLHLGSDEKVIGTLEAGDMAGLRQAVFFAKLKFLCHFVVRHPFRVWKLLCSRFGDYYRFYHKAPCGIKICVHVESERQKDLVRKALSDFVALKLISGWRERNRGRWVGWHDRRILERAGVLVEWLNSKQKRSDLSLLENVSQEEVRSLMSNKVIWRHAAVYTDPRLNA